VQFNWSTQRQKKCCSRLHGKLQVGRRASEWHAINGSSW
jgi:hypothetical protein